MKIILTTLCLLVASMTTSYADAFGEKVFKKGEVISFHNDETAFMFYYIVKYDNILYFCTLWARAYPRELKCEYL